MQSVRKAMVRLLQAAGYPARAYASGHQLLQHWTVDRPECLLLDLQMGDQCGAEVLQALTLAEVHVPVLIITAQDSPALRTECMYAPGCCRLLEETGGQRRPLRCFEACGA